MAILDQNKICLIFKLARLHFLFPGFLLFSLGYLISIHSGINFDIQKFLFGYLAFGFAHLSISFSNDYFDRNADVNSKKTIFTGGSKVLVEHPNLASFAHKIAILLLITSTISFVIFAFFFSYSFWFVMYGVLGGLIGYFYSAPPISFSYKGAGEIIGIISIGFLIPGMGSIVASGSIDQSLLLFIFPLCCYGLFFMLNVEIPDLESDKIANKKNLIVKFGRRRGKILLSLSSALATIYILFLELSGSFSIYFPFGLFTIMSIIPLISSIFGLIENRDERKAINQQAFLNIVSIIFFILIVDLILFLNLIL